MCPVGQQPGVQFVHAACPCTLLFGLGLGVGWHFMLLTHVRSLISAHVQPAQPVNH